MISAVGRLATMGLVGGTVAGTAVAKPKTQKGEHNLNKFQTAVGLGALTVTPFIIKEAVKSNPRTAVNVANKAGVAIEKGAKYAVEYGKKAAEFVSKNKNNKYVESATKVVKDLFNTFKNSKIGKEVINVVKESVKKIASNSTVQKVVVKAEKALKDFAKAPTTKKGKIGLIAAGAALLAYAGLKTITNYYKKEGAIDQKYDDLHKKYERMIAIAPIINAQTGEPISFKDYSKLAQTMVK